MHRRTPHTSSFCMSMSMRGFQLPDECRAFWNVRDKLSVDNGLVAYGCRLVIPSTLRKMVLTELHASHQGASVQSRELS